MVVSDTSGTNDGNNTTSGSDDPTVSDSVPSAADDTTEIDLGSDGTDYDQRELEALRAERDALKAQLDAKGSRHRFVHGLRGFTAVVGVILSCILIAGAVLGVWASRSFLETDGFTERAGSLIEDPEVRGALSGWLSAEVNELIDAQSVIEDALPEEASLLAAPLSGAVDSFVGDQVTSFVNSDLFAELWVNAVEVAHSTAVDVLEGDAELVEAEARRASSSTSCPSSTTSWPRSPPCRPRSSVGPSTCPTSPWRTCPRTPARPSATPWVSTSTRTSAPSSSTTKVPSAPPRRRCRSSTTSCGCSSSSRRSPSPARCGSSTRRRRTLLQLTVGITLTMVLLRRLVMIFQDDLLELVQKSQNVGAVDAVASTFLDPLLDGALWVGLIALLVAVIAAVSGPYGWAVSLRTKVVGFSRSVAAGVSDTSQDEGTLIWVAAHRAALQIAGVVAGILVLWVFDVSWFWFFVLVAVIGAYEFGVTRFADQGDGARTAETTAETTETAARPLRRVMTATPSIWSPPAPPATSG